MTSELHELRAILTQALNKIDVMLSYRPSPHLPVLTEWLKTASDSQMRSTQLYALVKEEFAHHDLPPMTQPDIARLMRALGYVSKRNSQGMRWHKP